MCERKNIKSPHPSNIPSNIHSIHRIGSLASSSIATSRLDNIFPSSSSSTLSFLLSPPFSIFFSTRTQFVDWHFMMVWHGLDCVNVREWVSEWMMNKAPFFLSLFTIWKSYQTPSPNCHHKRCKCCKCKSKAAVDSSQIWFLDSFARWYEWCNAIVVGIRMNYGLNQNYYDHFQRASNSTTEEMPF